MLSGEPTRPVRQDTFDLRDQIHSDHSNLQAHADSTSNPTYATASDEEHSVLEDDSDNEDREMDYMDDEDDASSDLSIPNESIDFDLVYSLHSFAATVEGQANVVKGDSLFLMDDNNSYWWLVRVLKTQEVGYIPAENIETPFERLARLNKHRNVDLASATEAEREEYPPNDKLRADNPVVPSKSPSPIPPGFNPADPNSVDHRPRAKGVAFTPSLSVHRYPPAVWNEEDEEEDEDVEWDEGGYEDQDPGLAEAMIHQKRAEERRRTGDGGTMPGSELDDGMEWDDSPALEGQARTQQQAPQNADIPAALRAAAGNGGTPTPEQIQTQQRQQQIMEAQEREIQRHQQAQLEQQRQQQLLQQQQAQAQPSVQAQLQPLVQNQGPRRTGSRERLNGGQDVGISNAAPTLSQSAAPGSRRIDPAEVTETRKLTATPTIARDDEKTDGPLLPSAIMQKQEEERKRARTEEEADDARRKKSKGPAAVGPPVSSNVSSSGSSSSGSTVRSSGGKLRKERDPDEDSKEKEKEKKKKTSILGGLFRKKDKKDKDRNASVGSIESGELAGRTSEESNRSGSVHSSRTMDGVMSPVTAAAMQQQQQQQVIVQKNSLEAKRGSPQGPAQQEKNATSVTAPTLATTPSTPPQVSQHASQLRQRDQQQQALYQQYLNRSPASPPEAPSYGLQSAALFNAPPSAFHSPSSSTSATTGIGLGVPNPRPRPGSLILSSTSMDGGVGVPDLSVIRVFAGKNLQTEATFKTVLLNNSTTAGDLVKQAIQRFRLPSGDDENDYYLTVKQVEGGASAVLRLTEKPLVVFESLVEAAMEMPKVKRSSVGSISSVASNLSMHPAIRKLPMNDFTDDSAVKFYLNRRSEEGAGTDESVGDHDAEDTLIADISLTSGEAEAHLHLSPPRSQYLTVQSSGNNVSPERFSSPSYRFALQLIIYREDLPDDMIFDPLTEAIVFKHTLKDRPTSSSSAGTLSGISQAMRRKVFVLPKNVTVAEVIELGLDRFGILEGVVDGGDEVEDKLTKRRSSTRVRYGLTIDAGNHERELSPTSKVIDAFPRPPVYRSVERKFPDSKRRSTDSGQLLGTLDDISPDDPVFILRRATSYRSSTSRHRMSAPLDEIALQHLHQHRESQSSHGSDPSSPLDEKRQIIAAQRRALQATQQAIIKAQVNSVRGVDVLLPGNAMLRSSRYEIGDKMRYSYVQPDGETYDISDIIEEEWQESNPTNKHDLLEGVIARNKDNLGDKLDRVLNKIKNGKVNKEQRESVSQSSVDSQASLEPASPSEYSISENHSRSVTPGSAGLVAKTPMAPAERATSSAVRTTSPLQMDQRAGTPDTRTPTPKQGMAYINRRNPSVASVMSDTSAGYATAQTQLSPTDSPRNVSTPKPYSQRKRIVIPKDDFGFAEMMAVIEFGAVKPKKPLPPLDPVDAILFGRPLDVELHPEIREIYKDAFKQLEEMDKVLDEYMMQAVTRK